MSDEVAAKLKWRLFYPVKFGNWVVTIGILSGCACLFVFLLMRIVDYKNSVSLQLELDFCFSN